MAFETVKARCADFSADSNIKDGLAAIEGNVGGLPRGRQRRELVEHHSLTSAEMRLQPRYRLLWRQIMGHYLTCSPPAAYRLTAALDRYDRGNLFLDQCLEGLERAIAMVAFDRE